MPPEPKNGIPEGDKGVTVGNANVSDDEHKKGLKEVSALLREHILVLQDIDALLHAQDADLGQAYASIRHLRQQLENERGAFVSLRDAYEAQCKYSDSLLPRELR